MASVHPGLVGVEHDWNLVGHGESRLKPATHLGPGAHLDPVVPVSQPCGCLEELRLRYGIVCPTQVAAGIPPRVWPDGPGQVTVRCHSRDAQVEVGLARSLVAGVDPREGPVGDAFARLTCVDKDQAGPGSGQVPAHAGSQDSHSNDSNTFGPLHHFGPSLTARHHHAKNTNHLGRHRLAPPVERASSQSTATGDRGTRDRSRAGRTGRSADPGGRIHMLNDEPYRDLGSPTSTAL
jgi:hypothetical protein